MGAPDRLPRVAGRLSGRFCYPEAPEATQARLVHRHQELLLLQPRQSATDCLAGNTATPGPGPGAPRQSRPKARDPSQMRQKA